MFGFDALRHLMELASSQGCLWAPQDTLLCKFDLHNVSQNTCIDIYFAAFIKQEDQKQLFALDHRSEIYLSNSGFREQNTRRLKHKYTTREKFSSSLFQLTVSVPKLIFNLATSSRQSWDKTFSKSKISQVCLIVSFL